MLDMERLLKVDPYKIRKTEKLQRPPLFIQSTCSQQSKLRTSNHEYQHVTSQPRF
uniref:Uncharacterized protein n=1 Tax=Rhizophora mucronata TaxID=61149 RepID=A0A2P2P536_RHIMU